MRDVIQFITRITYDVMLFWRNSLTSQRFMNNLMRENKVI
jgi:hypothetical protein